MYLYVSLCECIRDIRVCSDMSRGVGRCRDMESASLAVDLAYFQIPQDIYLSLDIRD